MAHFCTLSSLLKRLPAVHVCVHHSLKSPALFPISDSVSKALTVGPLLFFQLPASPLSWSFTVSTRGNRGFLSVLGLHHTCTICQGLDLRFREVWRAWKLTWQKWCKLAVISPVGPEQWRIPGAPVHQRHACYWDLRERFRGKVKGWWRGGGSS